MMSTTTTTATTTGSQPPPMSLVIAVTLLLLLGCSLLPMLTTTTTTTTSLSQEQEQQENQKRQMSLLQSHATTQSKSRLQPQPTLLKVYILAGQSNMVGFGSIQHLKELLIQSNEANECNNNTNYYYNFNSQYYDHLQDPVTGGWKIIDNNIYCEMLQEEYYDNDNNDNNENDIRNILLDQKLQIRGDDNSCNIRGWFGPEIGFGSLLSTALLSNNSPYS